MFENNFEMHMLCNKNIHTAPQSALTSIKVGIFLGGGVFQALIVGIQTLIILRLQPPPKLTPIPVRSQSTDARKSYLSIKRVTDVSCKR